MIFTETLKRRRFVGRLDPGTEIISELKELCKRHRISCADVWATGFLRNIELQIFDHGVHHYQSIELGSIAYQLVSFQGNISLLGADTTVHVHVTLLPDFGSGLTELRGGRIAKAEVIALEFSIETFDDFTLMRDHDPGTGFDQWMQLLVASASTAAVAPLGVDRATAPKPADDGSLGSSDDNDDEEIELVTGDFLEHPRLGHCEVLNCDGERVTIRMPKGRTGELHMSILRLKEVVSQGPGPGRTFHVEIRRRNP